MPQTINCGIIGCGVIAPSHIESFQLDPDVNVTWVCDLNEARAQERAKRYGVANVTTDFNDMLADPELHAVAICTDHNSHEKLVNAALKAGKHVICEKALAAHPDQLDSMLAVSEQHPELAFAGIFQHRFDATFRFLRKTVQEGYFGKLLTASLHMNCYRGPEYYRNDAWRGTVEEEGGAVLINQAIHFIDALQWSMGGVKELAARVENRDRQGIIECEDTAVASLVFKSGALGTIAATSSSQLKWDHTLYINGTDGTIDIRNDEVVRLVHRDPKILADLEQQVEHLQAAAQVTSGKAYYGSGHAAQIRDFVQAIREKRQPFVSGKDAAETNRIVFAIYEASKTGKWVQL